MNQSPFSRSSFVHFLNSHLGTLVFGFNRSVKRADLANGEWRRQELEKEAAAAAAAFGLLCFEGDGTELVKGRVGDFRDLVESESFGYFNGDSDSTGIL
jgi:hypothetical protein